MALNRREIFALAISCAPFGAEAGRKKTYCHPIFGQLEFETVDREWARGGAINFTKGFDRTKIRPLYIPQIVGIPRSSDGARNSGKIQFHVDAHAQLRNAFEMIEREGMLKKMISFGGARFQPRLRKPLGPNGESLLSRLPSNHSFGTAFDVNARDRRNGATAEIFAEIFEANGFLWGKEFNDPMHFEVKEFIGSSEYKAAACSKIA